MAAFFTYVLLPTVFIFPLAVTSTEVLDFPPNGFGAGHLAAVVQVPLWRDSFATSFEVGLAAAFFATAVGTVAAFLLPSAPRLVRTAVEISIVAPLVVPPIVFAVAWFAFFGQLHLIGSPVAVAIAHGVLGLPLVYLNVVAGLAGLDRRLLLASRSLGAGSRTTFFLIAVPLLAPSIIAGAALTFVLSFDELIVALFVGGGLVATLPVTMWNQILEFVSPDVAAAAALSVILTLGGLAVALLSWRGLRLARGPAWQR